MAAWRSDHTAQPIPATSKKSINRAKPEKGAIAVISNITKISTISTERFMIDDFQKLLLDPKREAL